MNAANRLPVLQISATIRWPETGIPGVHCVIVEISDGHEVTEGYLWAFTRKDAHEVRTMATNAAACKSTAFSYFMAAQIKRRINDLIVTG